MRGKRKRKTTRPQVPMKPKSQFDTWWDNEGSGMSPKEGEDKEEHTKRVALMAWRNGMYEAEMQLDEDSA